MAEEVKEVVATEVAPKKETKKAKKTKEAKVEEKKVTFA